MAKEFAKKFYNSSQWIRCRNSYIETRIMHHGGMPLFKAGKSHKQRAAV